jgi:hypothetical protein
MAAMMPTFPDSLVERLAVLRGALGEEQEQGGTA